MRGDSALKGDVESIRANAKVLTDQQSLVAAADSINRAMGGVLSSGSGLALTALYSSLSPLRTVVNMRMRAEQQVGSILGDYASQLEQIQQDTRAALLNLEESQLALDAAQAWLEDNDATDPVPASVRNDLAIKPSEVGFYQNRLDELDQQRHELDASIASKIDAQTSCVFSSPVDYQGILATIFASPAALSMGIDPLTAVSLTSTLADVDRMTPLQVKTWFEDLTADQQQWLIDTYPAIIGNLDGLDPNIRHNANLFQANADIVALNRRIEAIDSEVASPSMSMETGQTYRTAGDTEALIIEREALIQRRTEIEDLIIQIDEWNTGESQHDQKMVLLAYHGNTLHVQAAVAIGDITTATNINVFVPGMNTTVGGETVTDAITSLNIQRKITEKELGGLGSTAGILWLGYDSPNTEETLTLQQNSGASNFSAQQAAADLVRFSNGLVATSNAESKPLLTLSGHSYGTEVGFYALNDPTQQFDQVVFFGSPGRPKNSDPVIPPEKIYFASNSGDWIQELTSFMPVHGDYVPYLENEGTHLDVGPVMHGGIEYVGTADKSHDYVRTEKNADGSYKPTSTDLNIGLIAAGKTPITTTPRDPETNPSTADLIGEGLRSNGASWPGIP